MIFLAFTSGCSDKNDKREIAELHQRVSELEEIVDRLNGSIETAKMNEGGTYNDINEALESLETITY